MDESLPNTAAPQSVEDDASWHPQVVKTQLLLHGLFLVMAAAILVMSFLMRTEGETSVFLPWQKQPLPPSCTTKVMLGIDCPGCGMTRAFISISHGQFANAFRFNAASFVVYAFVAIQVPWHLLQIGLLVIKRRAIHVELFYYFPIVVVVLITLHWLWRISYQEFF